MDHPVLAKSKKLEEKQKGNGKITFKMHMERIEGQSIYDVKLSKEQAITLLQEAKSCCLYLINENIIWKDVNDGNIFFTNEGHLKICDFGFWRKIEKQSSLSGISMMGGCT